MKNMEGENLSKVTRVAASDITLQPPLISQQSSDILYSESVTHTFPDEDGAVPSTSGTSAAIPLGLRQREVNPEPAVRFDTSHHIRPEASSRRAKSPPRGDASMPRRRRSTGSRTRTDLQRRRPRRQRALIFPHRLCALPPVKAVRKVYANVRGSNSLLSCALMAVEVAALCVSAPAVAAWEPLFQMAHTPLLVADLLLCKGLDMAQRALPCLAQTPQQMVEAVALCACGVPVGLAYMACKAWLRVIRACVCDAPAVCVGVPAFAACAAVECCLCDAPFALCGLPARLTAAAARLAVGDARALISAFEKCSERVLGPLGYVETSDDDDDDENDGH